MPVNIRLKKSVSMKEDLNTSGGLRLANVLRGDSADLSKLEAGKKRNVIMSLAAAPVTLFILS